MEVSSERLTVHFSYWTTKGEKKAPETSGALSLLTEGPAWSVISAQSTTILSRDHFLKTGLLLSF
jgi:hypothetical protein